ncbi:MAG: diguanylate cyclase, partial [Pseudomonadota bacterium]
MLAAGAHIAIVDAIDEQDGAAEVINVAGRQRMLSQRTVLYLSMYHQTGEQRFRRAFEDTIALLLAQHRSLTRPPGPLALIDLNTPEIQRLYFGGLDQDVRYFIRVARNVQALSDPDDQQRLIVELAEIVRGDLLTDLDRAVALYAETVQAQTETLKTIAHITLAVLILTLAFEALFVFRPLVRRLTDTGAELYRFAMFDALTGLRNRRSFFTEAKAVASAQDAAAEPFSALLIDIDFFKSINDTHGHDAGDAALKHIAGVIEATIRPPHIPARLGGEEFVALIAGADADAAGKVAEDLRAAMENSAFAYDGVAIPITASIGVAQSDAEDSVDQILSRADIAVYAAK